MLFRLTIFFAHAERRMHATWRSPTLVDRILVMLATVLRLLSLASALALLNHPLPTLRRATARRLVPTARRAPAPVLALNVRIDDTWYDLSRWRAAHPSGPHWIDGFDGCDATEVMYAFHSDEAMAMLERLPRSREPPTELRVPPATPLMLAFRRLRAQLIADGWYERVWWREAATLAPCLLLYGVGTALARRASLLATVLLALGSTSAGWIAHDYVHGRGRWCCRRRSQRCGRRRNRRCCG